MKIVHRCESSPPPNLMSSGHTMAVEFNSKASHKTPSVRGFFAQYSFVEGEKVLILISCPIYSHPIVTMKRRRRMYFPQSTLHIDMEPLSFLQNTFYTCSLPIDLLHNALYTHASIPVWILLIKKTMNFIYPFSALNISVCISPSI